MSEREHTERYPYGPYDFVPLVDDVAREAIVTKDRSRSGHDRATGLSGVITGEFRTATPLRVGTGIFELGDGDDEPRIYQPMFRVGGTPTIPGSSMKGAVRSVVEAITESCIQTSAYKVGLRPCALRITDQPERVKLCPACRMFGAQGFLGRVAFADAPLVEGGTVFHDLPALWRPRREQSKRYYGDHGKGSPKGRKFYRHGYPETGSVPTEVCPARSVFSVRLDFRDLSEAELGTLLIGIGCSAGDGNRPLMHKLGGGKPSCCGSARFALKGLHVHDARGRWTDTDFSRQKEHPSVSPDAYIEAATNGDTQIVLATQYQRVQDIMFPRNTNELRLCGYEPQFGRRRP